MRNRKLRRVSKNYIRFLVALRWVLYFVISLVCMLITTCGDPTDVKPLLLIPLGIALSLFLSEIPSAAIGFYCGLLIDVSAGKLWGVSSLLLIAVCVGSSLLFTHILRRNIINYSALVIAAVVIYFSLDYFFYFKMWGYESIGVVLRTKTVPCALLTCLFSPVIYFLITFITRKLGAADRVVLEEQNKNIERI